MVVMLEDNFISLKYLVISRIKRLKLPKVRIYRNKNLPGIDFFHFVFEYFLRDSLIVGASKHTSLVSLRSIDLPVLPIVIFTFKNEAI